MNEHVRVVGIQAQGSVNVKRGFIEATAIQENAAQYHLDHRVAIVQGRCATGVVVGKALGLIPLLPRLTAPFVEVGQREAHMCAGVCWIGFEGPFEIDARFSVGFDSPALQTLEASQPAVVGLEAGQRGTLGRAQPGSIDTDFQRAGNLFRNLVLHREQVPRGDVVAIGPELTSRVGVEQLDRDADHVAGSTDTAAQEVGSGSELGRCRCVLANVAANAWGYTTSMAPKREARKRRPPRIPAPARPARDRPTGSRTEPRRCWQQWEAWNPNGYSPILPGPITAGSIGLYSPSGGTLLTGDR